MSVPLSARRASRLWFLLLFAGSGSMAPLSAEVTGRSWLGDHGDGGNGSWSTPGNWNPVGVPVNTGSDNHIANFYLDNNLLDAPTAKVTLAGATAARGIVIGVGKAVTMELDAGTALSLGTKSIAVGTDLETGVANAPASLTMKGSAGGNSTVSLGGLLEFRNASTLTFSGPNLAVTSTVTNNGQSRMIGVDNHLNVEAGASVELYSLWAGNGTATTTNGHGNAVVVKGAQSKLVISGGNGNIGLRIGSFGGTSTIAAAYGNSLSVESGATVEVTTGTGGTNQNNLSIGTGEWARSNSVIVTGADSTLALKDGSAIHIGNTSQNNRGDNRLEVRDGAKVVTNGQTTIYDYINTLGVGANRLTIANGGTFRSSSTIENRSLLQLAAGGVLEGADALGDPQALGVSVTSTGRFEVAGTGLGQTVTTSVAANGTFAIGLTDGVTGNTTASLLTLQSTVAFTAGSLLEMSIFNGNTSDQINFAPEGGLLTGNVTLRLVFENGYTPESGGSWTLFTGETGGITATFDLSQLDPLLWNTDQFNEQGQWKLVAIPESSSVALSLAGLLTAAIVLRRRTLS
ncbi:MAG TPA: hypothetical protein VNQ90_19065 [Chthoniobacteraceae bacterium]|nr:hypothetical protein [Chthoniobacteraceae bacterium]